MDRRFRMTACAAAILAITSSARAQRPHLTAREVAQIANEALRVIVPPDSTLSGVAVSSRGVVFNVRGSLAAFGAPIGDDTVVRFDRPVRAVSDSVLSDCSQMVPLPCAGLGARVYVSIAPLSLTASHAHVRVNVLWPTRVAARAGASKNHVYLSGFSATIRLIRNANGAWVFQKQDPSVLVM